MGEAMRLGSRNNGGGGLRREHSRIVERAHDRIDQKGDCLHHRNGNCFANFSKAGERQQEYFFLYRAGKIGVRALDLYNAAEDIGKNLEKVHTVLIALLRTKQGLLPFAPREEPGHFAGAGYSVPSGKFSGRACHIARVELAKHCRAQRSRRRILKRSHTEECSHAHVIDKQHKRIELVLCEWYFHGAGDDTRRRRRIAQEPLMRDRFVAGVTLLYPARRAIAERPDAAYVAVSKRAITLKRLQKRNAACGKVHIPLNRPVRP